MCVCVIEQGEFQQKAVQAGKLTFVSQKEKAEGHFLDRALVEGQVWKYEKGNWLRMIFVLMRMFFANKNDCIQEIADCHHFLLLKRVPEWLHARQMLATKRLEACYLICCI